MKIILEAFGGKMISGVMDIPDNSTDKWKMILDRGAFVKVGYSGDEISSTPSYPLICTFEWTGKHLMTKPDSARVYQLVDIDKR